MYWGMAESADMGGLAGVGPLGSPRAGTREAGEVGARDKLKG